MLQRVRTYTVPCTQKILATSSQGLLVYNSHHMLCVSLTWCLPTFRIFGGPLPAPLANSLPTENPRLLFLLVHSSLSFLFHSWAFQGSSPALSLSPTLWASTLFSFLSSHTNPGESTFSPLPLPLPCSPTPDCINPSTAPSRSPRSRCD